MNRKLAIDILARDNKVILTCNGNSMRSLMKPGDALHIQKVAHDKLRVGDAVFVRINGGLQVHKISAIDKSKERWQISNARGLINGWVGTNSVFGLCVQVEDKVIVSQEELNAR